MNLYDVFIGQLKFYRGSAESADQAVTQARDYMFRTDAQRLGEWDGAGRGNGEGLAEFRAVMLGPRFPLRPGDHVVCQYRIPTALQYWLHPVHVGVIQEPGDSIEWNGHNTERHYCEVTGKAKVLYSTATDAFTQHDTVCDLVPAPFGKTESWMLKDTHEAVRLAVHVHLATRRPEWVAEHVAPAIRSAFDWHGGGGSAVYQFASWRKVKSEQHRFQLRKELAASIRDAHDPDDLRALRLLDTIAETAEMGEQLAPMAAVSPGAAGRSRLRSPA